METAHSRHMLYLHGKKARLSLAIACILILTGSLRSSAQERYREEQDDKPYYFGITLSTVFSRFQLEHHPAFLQQDSILSIEATNTAGISLRLLAAMRLSNRFELRFNPGLVFTQRPIVYDLKYPVLDHGYRMDKSVESIFGTLPLALKFKSDRIGNFRVYLLGGGKVDWDWAANARAKKGDDLIKLQPLTYGIEGGIGFNFYRKAVTISPEIKISNGLNNLHARNENLIYSRVVDRIQSRMIFFSIHLEG